MKIAILSDTHDNIWNLEKTIQLIKRENCEALIHCGDFCAPFISPLLVKTGLPIYACLGNNDEDHWAIVKKANSDQFNLWPLSQEFGELELGGKKIAFCHYPKLGELLARSGDYDAVFHGHTHEGYQRMEGKTILANPGAVCGIVGGKPGPASFGVYETSKHRFEHITIHVERS